VGVVDVHVVPFIDGIAYGLLLFLVAAGMMVAFAVGGTLNLAHGTVFAIGAYLAAVLSDGTWTAFAISVLVGATVGAGCGGTLAAALAPIRGRGHLAQALLTMGVAFIATDLMRSVFGRDDLAASPPAGLAGTVTVAGHMYPAYRLALIAVALLVAAAGWWVLTRTTTGALVRAAVDDSRMLATIGVNPATVHLGVMLAAGALAGLAGALGAPVLGAGPSTATTVLLWSLVVVVLGGMRSVPATLVAALGVGQVQTLGVTVLPTVAPFLLFAAMAAVLVVSSRTRQGVPA
jgi:branched-chain amino acid transport system permease protein